MSFHPSAWLAWLGAAITVVLAVDQPLATTTAVAALSFVAAASPASGAGARSYALMVRIGLFFIAIRVVLFGLTGHTGPTTLFVLPSAQAPAWLGGFSLGGRITGEVVAQALAEGLKVAAVLAAFGVFLSVVPVSKVMRSVPRFLFEAGLIVGIALTFVPVMMRTAADIRDAQRMRGHRFRGLRSMRPLVVPVLAGAMDRSLTLAASMEVRGYGRAGVKRDTRRARAIAAGSALLTAAGVSAALFGVLPGIGLVAVGIAGLTWSGHELAAGSARTRYRPEVVTAWDRALIAGAAVTAVAAIAARVAGFGWWYAYPVAALPDANALALTPAVGLILPAVLAGARGMLLTRAQHPVVAVEVNP